MGRIILGTMASFFKLMVEFACPSCGNDSTVESAIESGSAVRDVAAQAAARLSLKCATCGKLADKGTSLKVYVQAISAEQFAAWIEVHRTSLHTLLDRNPAN